MKPTTAVLDSKDTPAPAASRVKSLTLLSRAPGARIFFRLWDDKLVQGSADLGQDVLVREKRTFSIRFDRSVVPVDLGPDVKPECGVAVVDEDFAKENGVTLDWIEKSVRNRRGAYGVNYCFLHDDKAVAGMTPQFLRRHQDDQEGKMGPIVADYVRRSAAGPMVVQ